MSKIMKRVMLAGALVCTLLVGQLPYSIQVQAYETNNSSVQETVKSSDNVNLKDDFYASANSEWLKNAKIEKGNITNSTFDEVSENILKQKKDIIKELLANENNYPENSDEKKIINLYKNAINMDARKNQGIGPLKEIIDEINNMKSVKDISNLKPDSKVTNTLFNMVVKVDEKDSNSHALYITRTPLILGDPSLYINPDEDTVNKRNLIAKYYLKVLELSGYSEKQAQAKIDSLFKFEETIASYCMGTNERLSDTNAIDKLYNVYTLDQLEGLAPNVDFKTICKNFNVNNAKTIVLQEPKWLKGLNDLYTDENLQMFKDVLEVNNVVGMSRFLGKSFDDARIEYSNEVTGTDCSLSDEDYAIQMVNSYLPDIMGKIYAEKCCSEKVKNDATELTEEIIAAFKERLTNSNWMSDVTKQKAIEKLDKMVMKVAYPEKFEDCSGLDIKSFEEGSSLIENVRNIQSFVQEKSMNELNEKVDRTRFACEPDTVDAFYDPTTNSITIPAGILQGEFYNEDYSKEKNLGGIGTVIGHEITHAFDTTGGKFDAEGNLSNWWTEEDYQKFKEKTEKVKEFYSKVKMADGKFINGALTVGENIADLGGVGCTLDIVNKMENPNYKEFFESQATIWRLICTKDFEEYSILYDVHSPRKARTNAVLPQFEEFYTTYDIKPGDGMYVKPEDRIKVW